LGEGDAAENIYRRVLDEDPTDGRAHFLLGALYLADREIGLSHVDGISRLELAKLNLEQAADELDGEEAVLAREFTSLARDRIAGRRLTMAVTESAAPEELPATAEAVGERIRKRKKEPQAKSDGDGEF